MMKMINIKKHDMGAAVEDVQQRLSKLGYLPEEQITGVYDDACEEAVRAFTRDQGLKESGEVTDSVWVTLVDACFELGDRTLYLRMPYFHVSSSWLFLSFLGWWFSLVYIHPVSPCAWCVLCLRSHMCASACVCAVAVWACGHRAGQFCEQTACLLGESLPGLSISPGRQDSHPLSPLMPLGACRAQAWVPGLRGAVGEAFRILPE